MEILCAHVETDIFVVFDNIFFLHLVFSDQLESPFEKAI